MSLKKLFEKIAIFFKTRYKISVDLAIEVVTDVDSTSTVFRKTIESCATSLGYEVVNATVDDLGEVTIDPVTNERIRRNGKFAKIHAVKYTYEIHQDVNVLKETVKKKKYDLSKFAESVVTILPRKLTEILNGEALMLHVSVASTNVEVKLDVNTDSSLAKYVFDSLKEGTASNE
jgi:hypothetical protein